VLPPTRRGCGPPPPPPPPPPTHCRLLAAAYSLPPTHCRLLTAAYSLPPAHCRPLTAITHSHSLLLLTKKRNSRSPVTSKPETRNSNLETRNSELGTGNAKPPRVSSKRVRPAHGHSLLRFFSAHAHSFVKGPPPPGSRKRRRRRALGWKREARSVGDSPRAERPVRIPC
jgi:hypothetical protein